MSSAMPAVSRSITSTKFDEGQGASPSCQCFEARPTLPNFRHSRESGHPFWSFELQANEFPLSRE